LKKVEYKNRFEQTIGKIIHTMNKKLISDYDTKPFVKYIQKNMNGGFLVGVEVGVCHGYNAIDILNKLNIKKLFLIDPWDDSVYDGNNSQKWQDNEYAKVVKNMKQFEDKVTIMKMYSNEAYKKFDNNSLDFVYIDTVHTYDLIMEDFINWFPKVKNGGIFGGHGFDAHWKLPFAIVDICRKYNFDCDGTAHDWWIIKK